MGHAIHFLQRLERVPTPQADLALALYRDPQLVKYMLTQVRLPDRAERVALALDHKADGPHVIVSREGAFITCLAEGMTVGDLPVVPRSQIDRISAEMDKLREVAAQVRERGELKRLFRRLYKAGSNLSREDMVALSFMYPLMFNDIWKATVDLADKLAQFRARYKPQRYRRLNRETEKELRVYWQSSWAMAHYLVLQGEHIHLLMDLLLARMEQLEVKFLNLLSWPASRTLTTPILMRGTWAVARTGKHGLPAMKQFFAGAKTWLQLIDGATNLTATGLRHRRLAAEIQKTLARRREPELVSDSPPLHHELAPRLIEQCLAILERGSEQLDKHRELGQQLALEFSSDEYDEYPRHKYERAEDVPDELAYTLPLNVDVILPESPKHLKILDVLLPWIANVSAEDMYVPAALVDKFPLPWHPVLTLEQLHLHYLFYGGPPTGKRVPKKPGRNAPCTCGSGKKYKRCCGA